MKTIMKFKLSFTFLLLYSSISLAQWNFGLSTQNEYSDNPFRNSLAEKSFISSLDFNLQRDLNFLNVGYTGSYLTFAQLPERNFYTHQISLTKNFENSSLGFLTDQRFGKDIYSYFDFSNYILFYNHLFQIDSIYFSLAPNLSITNYDEINILDNAKLSISYYMNKGFDSGTTFIVGGAFNLKKYLSPTQTGVYSYLDENNNLVEESYVDKNVSSISQLLTFGRIAQSITSTTGLAFQFTNRSILSGFGAFVKDLNLYYGDESEIFDDPVNYEGNSISLELTQLLFEDMQIKAGYYFNNKHYPSQGLYNNFYEYNTEIMRSDAQSVFNLSISKSIPLGFLDDLHLSVGLIYQMISNKSNSYLFDYKSNSINLNLGLEL